MARDRDNQRKRVYDWERAHVPGHDDGMDATTRMPLEECRALVESVAADYNLTPPVVKDGRGRRNAIGGQTTISLPLWARCVPIVLHEVAHTILLQKGQYGAAYHGPDFMRVFLDLLEKYAKLPLRELRSSAAKAGLRVAPAASCPCPMTREERRLRAEVKTTQIAHDAAQSALREYLLTKKKS